MAVYEIGGLDFGISRNELRNARNEDRTQSRAELASECVRVAYSDRGRQGTARDQQEQLDLLADGRRGKEHARMEILEFAALGFICHAPRREKWPQRLVNQSTKSTDRTMRMKGRRACCV